VIVDVVTNETSPLGTVVSDILNPSFTPAVYCQNQMFFSVFQSLNATENFKVYWFSTINGSYGTIPSASGIFAGPAICYNDATVYVTTGAGFESPGIFVRFLMFFLFFFFF
jgi:hypothetical protein